MSQPQQSATYGGSGAQYATEAGRGTGQGTGGGGGQVGHGGIGAAGQVGQQSLLFGTESYLSEDVRVPVIQQLNRTLADATILKTHAKFAHWNVKGPEFVGLHELFDELAEALEEHIDLIAERITALGGQAMGTAGMAVSNCRLPHMQPNAVTGSEYVSLLAERVAVHDANLYQAIDTATQYGDLDTADLLNEVSREVSKFRWMLEAHFQTQPVSTIPTVGGASGGGGRGGRPMGGGGTAQTTAGGGTSQPAGGGPSGGSGFQQGGVSGEQQRGSERAGGQAVGGAYGSR